MATKIPEEAAAGQAYPQPADPPIMGSSNKAEASVDTSATVSDQAVRGKGSAGVEASSKTCPFQIGEIVLAWYGEQLYEAKILETAFGACWRMFVHYNGWKKSYNEWLSDDRLLKDTEANRRLKKELDLQMKKGKSANSKPKTGTGSRGKKKRAGAGAGAGAGSGTDPMEKPGPSLVPSPEKTTRPSSPPVGVISTPLQAGTLPTHLPEHKLTFIPTPTMPTPSEENVIPTPAQETVIPTPSQANATPPPEFPGVPISIPMPPPLKKQLVHDWECVVLSDKLVKLPRSPTVNELLKKYKEQRVKKEPRYARTIVDFVSGLHEFFDQRLGAKLLYKGERRQYDEATANNVLPSSVFGAEHLLRLFVKMPEWLKTSGVDEDCLDEFQQNMVDVLKYLQKNQAAFFLPLHHYIDNPAASEKQED